MRIRNFMKRGLILALSGLMVFSSSITSFADGWGGEEGNWYYLDGEGNKSTNRWVWDQYWYYFDENGDMAKGLKTIKLGTGETNTYYFNPTKIGNYPEGRMMTGWQYVDGKYMYFDSEGRYTGNNTKETGSIKGIDVSQYQGNMDWTKVKAQGIEFAFVRVGHGDHKVDPYYKKNMKAANEAGIKTGAYFYSTATTVSQAKSDAQWVIDQLQGYNVSYPVALDMEDSSQISLGKQAITNMAKVFCDEIKSAGYTPMVYCNENWAKNYIDLNQLEGVYKWIARYNNTYNEAISRDIWQAGSTTLMEGITINSVDCDFGYTDFKTIVTPRTKHLDSYTKNSGMWVENSTGWWYDKGDGTYPKNEWFYDNSKYYHFDANGYMQTGWLKSGNYWFYLTSSGMVNNTWLKLNNKWYYFNAEGVMITGWTVVKNRWYYFDANGVLQTGWIKSSSGYYYYLSDDGMLSKTWFKYYDDWYYLNEDGVMLTGWQEIDDKYYYFYSSGKMAKDTSVDGYTIDSNGQWVE
ncbi:MAG: cell wall-binding protein [Eubacterium sp.]|nr:cell wall-binding protein [Eubacterium sp.]